MQIKLYRILKKQAALNVETISLYNLCKYVCPPPYHIPVLDL